MEGQRTMNLLFTICARAGSKGVKSKNIRCIDNIPLLYYTLSAYQLFCKEYGQEFHSIDLAINSDSSELVNQFQLTNISGQHIGRKEELAGDFVGKMEVIRDTLNEMERIKEKKYNIIIDLDLTSPIRSVEDIKGTLDCVLGDSNADVAFSVTESRRSPYFNMVSEKENGYFDKLISSNYVSRQQTPKCYDMNASIYAYQRQYLKEFEKKESRNSLIWEMDDTGILDIDCEKDFELIQILMRFISEHNEKYYCIVDNIANIVKKY